MDPYGDPWIRTVFLSLTPPSLKDNTADTDRLIKALRKSLDTEEICLDLAQIRELPRIHFASQEGGLKRLQGLVMDRLNHEIRKLTRRHGISPQSIVAMAVAGNTTMTRFFLGLDPYWICREPYISVVNRPPLLRSSDVGLLIHPSAPVLAFPNVGSYFGGDLMAGILASGMNQQEEVSLLVDVGANAEVVIGNRDWLMACAGGQHGPSII